MAANYFNYRYVFGKKKGGANSFVLNLDCYREGATDNALVVICLAGFDVKFVNADHHFKQLTVRAMREGWGSAKQTIPVRVTLGLRDGSGNWDDAFDGEVWINLLVIDNEPDVHSKMLSIGLTSRQRDRQSHYFYDDVPGPDYHALAMMQGLEYVVEDGDKEIAGIEVEFSAGKPLNGQSRLAFNCGVGGSSDSHWNSYIDGTVLYLPKSRYELESFSRGGNNRDKGPDVNTAELRFSSAVNQFAYGISKFGVNYDGDSYNGYPAKHLHRLVMHAELQGVDFATNRDSRMTMRTRGGIRDWSGTWDDHYQYYIQGPVIGIKPPAVSGGPQFRPMPDPLSDKVKDLLEKSTGKRKKKKDKSKAADISAKTLERLGKKAKTKAITLQPEARVAAPAKAIKEKVAKPVDVAPAKPVAKRAKKKLSPEPQ